MRDKATIHAELYNPATGTWTATGSLHAARVQHTATLLQNGQVLDAGGQDSNYNLLASAEVYTPKHAHIQRVCVRLAALFEPSLASRIPAARWPSCSNAGRSSSAPTRN